MQQTIKDLFEEPSGLKELAEEEEVQKEKQQRESRRRHDRKKDKVKEEEKEEKPADSSMSQEQIEQVCEMFIVTDRWLYNSNPK